MSMSLFQSRILEKEKKKKCNTRMYLSMKDTRFNVTKLLLLPVSAWKFAN